jgi:hypothetical protein
MIAFLTVAGVPLDNNLAERALKRSIENDSHKIGSVGKLVMRGRTIASVGLLARECIKGTALHPKMGMAL